VPIQFNEVDAPSFTDASNQFHAQFPGVRIVDMVCSGSQLTYMMTGKSSFVPPPKPANWSDQDWAWAQSQWGNKNIYCVASAVGIVGGPDYSAEVSRLLQASAEKMPIQVPDAFLKLLLKQQGLTLD
jgi:hypothetical protein